MNHVDICSNFMPSRLEHLSRTLEGYKLTSIPFIEYHENTFSPCITADDIGIYYFIPKIACFFQLPIEQAIVLFFNSIALISCVLGIIGFFLLYKGWLERTIAALGLIALTLFVCSITLDVYRVFHAVAVPVVPWSLYFCQKKYSSRFFYLFMVLSGSAVSLAHYIRLHSGTAVIIFIGLLLVAHPYLTYYRKMMLISLLGLGFILPMGYFHYVYSCHVDYVAQHFPGQQADQEQHVFWHQVYIGFGFLSNDLGISFADRVAHNKALTVNPLVTYPSQESEQILKHEVMKLIRTQKYFTFITWGAKVGVLLFFLLVFANIGLLVAFLYPKRWYIDCAFAAALGFNSLFAIFTIPYFLYCLGFITFAALYGIVSLNYGIEHGLVKNIFRKWKKLV